MSIVSPQQDKGKIQYEGFYTIAMREAHQGRLVFPCRGKKPLTANGNLNATTDEATITTWAKTAPDANVGIAFRDDSKEVGLDVDIDNLDEFQSLARSHGQDKFNTRAVKTGGGGYHFYFLLPQGVTLRNISKSEGLGFELKSNNQYLMAAGSVHPDTGKVYELVIDMQPEPMPEWLVKIASNGHKPRSPIAPPQPGSRHNSLISDIGRLRKLGHTEPEIETLALALNSQSPQPLLEAEVVSMVKEYEGQSKVNDDGSPKIFPLTDSGNAEHFTSVYADKMRYDHRRGRWLEWYGHYWREDNNGQVIRLALKANRERQKETINLSDADEKKKIQKWLIDSESRARLDSAIAIAKNLLPIADSGEEWDRNPWLFCVQNGVIDLRTGELRDGKPEDKVTMHSPVVYDAEASAPRFKQFLNEVFSDNKDLIEWNQRFWGYCLTGDTREQIVGIAHGNGANGKGRMTGIMEYVFGDYAYNAPFSTFELTQRAAIPNDLAALVGKRLVISSETNEGTRLNEARVKALSGQDSITARFLHGEFFTFQPVAKFLLAVNHRPRVQDDSYGFWRRVRLIPFNRQFQGKGEDKQLGEKLRTEASGILNWLIEGCLQWQKQGLDPTPECVLQATQEYQSESDPLSQFLLSEHCAFGTQARVKASNCYKKYCSWCTDQGMAEKERMTFTAFGRKMTQKFKKEQTRDGIFYIGLGLTCEGFVNSLGMHITESNVLSDSKSRMGNNIENTSQLFTTHENTSQAENSNELPDCPKCGANEWQVNANGKAICPCGYISYEIEI